MGSKQLLTAVITAAMTSSAFAGVASNAHKSIDLDARAKMLFTDSDNNGSGTSVWDAEIGVGVHVTNWLKAKLTAEFADNADGIDELLEEAYLVIDLDKAMGMPVVHAIKLGKYEANIGQIGQAFEANDGELTQRRVPNFKNRLAYTLETTEEVIGAQFYLDADLLGQLADSLNVQVYNTSENNNSFSSTDDTTVAVNWAKEFADMLWTASAKFSENTGAADSSIVSLGVEKRWERWSAYAQIMFLDDAPQYANSDYAAQIGAAYNITKDGKLSVAGEIEWVEDVAQQYTASLNWKPMSHLDTSLYVTHRDNDSAADDTIVGVEASVEVGSKASSTLIKNK